MTYNNRAFSRTVVLLDVRRNSVPRSVEYNRLENSGRVKDIHFTKNTDSSQIGDILQVSFPSLVGQDLTR